MRMNNSNANQLTGTWSPPSLVNGSDSVESRRAKWLRGSEPSNVNGSSDMVDDVRLLVLLPVFRISATDTFERKSKRNQTKADTRNKIEIGSKQEHELWCHSIEVGDHTPLYSTDNSSNARCLVPDISCSRKKRTNSQNTIMTVQHRHVSFALPFGRHLLLLLPFLLSKEWANDYYLRHNDNKKNEIKTKNMRLSCIAHKLYYNKQWNTHTHNQKAHSNDSHRLTVIRCGNVRHWIIDYLVMYASVGRITSVPK